MKNFLFTIIFLSLNIFATEDSIPVCPENGSHTKCINNFGVGYYIGAVINGKNHGYGVYENGKEKFEGEWFEGLRREGTQTFKDGSIYSGEWGIKYPSTMGITGKGTYFYPDSTKFEGEWLRHRPIFGVLTNKSGEETRLKYDWVWGEFKGGRIYKGTLTFEDGSTYEGEFDKFNKPTKANIYSSKKNSTQKKDAKKKNDNDLLSVSSGTGFAINDLGNIITNNHVVDGCASIKVHYKGEIFPSIIVARDIINDLALIKIDFKPTDFFSLKEEDPSLLDEIVVAGYPFGKKISNNVKVTKGVVSSLAGIGNNFSQIQIDAAIQPGNSGGPIIDLNGDLVGVAVSKLDLMTIIENYGVVPENTNFGIKSTAVKNLLLGNSTSFSSSKDRRYNKVDLIEKINESTFFLSCWMIEENIEKLRDTKLMFKDIEIK